MKASKFSDAQKAFILKQGNDGVPVAEICRKAAGAIRACDEHGWMQDRADPHARERAVDMARRDPPPGVSPDAAAAEVRDVLDSIGDTCPECPPQ